MGRNDKNDDNSEGGDEELYFDDTAPKKDFDYEDDIDDDDLGDSGPPSSSRKGPGGKGKRVAKGTFQSLGLSKDIFSGVNRMGYKLPTPVQRKSLPEALAGKDLVCMARTGSGKTAAFLIPVLERLQSHSPRIGARALILSPTRELAMQTVKFAKSLSHFTDLRVALLVGGDSMDDQFEALSRNPDIIIGTPGRVMHHLQEVPDFSLASVQVAVFDEADRLFEMGFAEQLKEILRTMPEERQTLLYSATLPKMLAQFARAGLRDPVLIRLDMESKVSEQLCLGFFTVRSGNKTAALLYLVREVLPRDKLTIIFAATKHHVEYLQEVLTEVGLPCSAIFGAMDFDARKLNLERFRQGRVKYLIVTDVAARGIDVPLLDYVINYSFPPLPKLFVHRVGRAARQGRVGAAFSLVDPEELAYMVDLHLFLGRPPQNVYKAGGYEGYTLAQLTPDLVHYGGLPQHLLDEENESLRLLTERNGGVLNTQWRVCENAMKQYRRTRPDPSKAAIRRAKLLVDGEEGGLHIHPMLLGSDPIRMAAGGSVAEMRAKDEMVKMLQGFRPQQTVLEVQRSDAGSLYKGLPVGGRKKQGVGGGQKHHWGTRVEVEAGIKVMRDIRKEHFGAIKRKREDVAKKRQLPQQGAEEGEAGGGEDHSHKGEEEFEDERAMEQEQQQHDDGDRHQQAKAKLSKAARRKIKKHKCETEGLSDSGEQRGSTCKSARSHTGSSTSYKDPRHFIEYGVSEHDQMVEDRLQPRSVEKGSEALLANRLEEALLDVQPDEALEMTKRKRIMHWDARKKKYIRATMSEMGEARGNQKLRSESGVTLSGSSAKKPTGEIYKKWQKKTNKTLALAGGDEDGDDGAKGGSDERGIYGQKIDDGRIMGTKKFRHMANKQAVVETGRGTGGRRAKEELKTAGQIHKERKVKEKERLRLAKKSVGGGRGSGGRGGGRGGGEGRGRGGFKMMGKR